MVLTASPAFAGFGLARWREQWALKNPAPILQIGDGDFNLGAGNAVEAHIRAYRRWLHRAWVAWARHRDALERAAEQAREAPPTSVPNSGGSCQALVAQAFGSRGLSVSLALFIADRESGCWAGAYNPHALANGHATGVFQWLSWGGYGGIWGWASGLCGHGGESAFNEWANIDTSACFAANYGWWPWGF